MMIRQFLFCLRLHTRQAFFHRQAVWANVISWGLRSGLTILLYQGVYRLTAKTGDQAIKGITLDVAISSVLFYVLYSGFNARDVARQIDKDYRTGAVEIWLNKPVSYMVMKMADVLGCNVPSMLVLTIMVVVFLGIHGLPDVTHPVLRLLWGVPLLCGGVLIAYLLYALIGLSVIWLQDSSSVSSLHEKLIMIFGGIYLPIAFLPGWLRYLGESLPAGTANYLAQIFYPDFFDNLPRFLLTQFIWIVVLSLSLRQVSRIGQSRITVNGG